MRSTNVYKPIAFLIALLTVMVSMLYWWQIMTSEKVLREEVIKQVEKRGGQLADAISNQIDSLVNDIDFNLVQLRNDYLTDNARFEANVALILLKYKNRPVVHVAVIGADGEVVYSSLGLKERVYAGDREHYKVHLDGKDRLNISKPIIGRVSNVWSILFTRPIFREGRFAGVVVISMSPEIISGELAKLELSSHDVIKLLHRDGDFLARNSNWQQAMGHSVSRDRPFLKSDSPRSGHYHAIASLDNVQRIFSWTRLESAELLVAVGIDEEFVLSALLRRAREDHLKDAVVTLVILLFGIGVCALLLALARHQERFRSAEIRYGRLYETMNDGYVMVDMQGRILNCNKSYQEMLGYTHEEVLQFTYADLTPKKWLGEESRIMSEQLIPRGYSNVYEKEYFRKDGSRLPVEIQAHLLRDSAGNPESMWAIVRDITERKLVQEALQFERDQLRQILDAHFGCVAVLSIDGQIVEINRKPLELMALTRPELLGRQFWEVGWLETESASQVKAMIQAAARGEIITRDIVSQFPGIGRRDMEATFVPLRDAAGLIVNVLVYGVDVTESKQVKLALEEERIFSAAILDHAGTLVVVLDREGRIRRFNRAAEKLSGFSWAEVEARYPWDTFLPSDCAELVREQAFYAKVRDRLRTSFNYTNEWLTRSGDRRLIEWVNSLIFDETDEVSYMVSVGIDVTERHKMEELLRKSESRLRQAQEIAQIGNWELALDNGYLWWSEEIFRLFEINSCKFGASYDAFLDIVHPEDKAMVNAAYMQSLQDRSSYQIVHRLLMADGRIKFVEERGDTDYAADGTPLRSYGTVQDITERTLIDQSLRQSLQEKEILLREVHHRVKNNLQIISSLLHFYIKKSREPEAVKVFGEMRDRLQSMSLVHEKLYNTENLSEVEFGDYARSLVKQLTASGVGSNNLISFNVKVSSLLLPIPVAIPLGMILTELVTNAIKYAFPNRRDGVVTIEMTEEAGQVSLKVCDDGVGLPSNFDNRNSESFGWRLMRALTEQLNGTITTESNAGLCVMVSFPRT